MTKGKELSKKVRKKCLLYTNILQFKINIKKLQRNITFYVFIIRTIAGNFLLLSLKIFFNLILFIFNYPLIKLIWNNKLFHVIYYELKNVPVTTVHLL